MAGTTVIFNDWESYTNVMDDATAGRLFKQMLAIRNGHAGDDPEDLKFVLAHIRQCWDEQDAKLEEKRIKGREYAERRWNKVQAPTDAPIPTPVPVHEPVRIKKVPSIINYSVDFQKFWDAYPKRKKKAMAYLRWNEALEKWVDPDFLIRKASDYAVECRLQHVEERYIMYPEGWLNQARYDDDFFTGTKQVDLEAISDGLDDILW